MVRLLGTVGYEYRYVNDSVIEIKGSVIGICSDIDRYFKIKYGVDISKKILDIEKYKEIIENYPYLAKLNLSQAQELFKIFTMIRDINAHLYLCKYIVISSELCDYFTSIIEPSYKIAKNNKLTVYGQCYLLSFLAQKNSLCPFYTSFFRISHFREMKSYREKDISNFQVEEQHKMQNYCGLGKLINNSPYSDTDFQFLNEVFKKYMTKVLFNLEKVCSYNKKGTKKSKSLTSV